MLWPHYGWSMRQASALLLVPDMYNWCLSEMCEQNHSVTKFIKLIFFVSQVKSISLNFTLKLIFEAYDFDSNPDLITLTRRVKLNELQWSIKCYEDFLLIRIAFKIII